MEQKLKVQVDRLVGLYRNAVKTLAEHEAGVPIVNSLVQDAANTRMVLCDLFPVLHGLTVHFEWITSLQNHRWVLYTQRGVQKYLMLNHALNAMVVEAARLLEVS